MPQPRHTTHAARVTNAGVAASTNPFNSVGIRLAPSQIATNPIAK